MTDNETLASTLLVGISNPATMPKLMDLAVGLHHVTDLPILVGHVVTVRGQMTLRSARSSPEVLEAQALLSSALEYAAAKGAAARAVVEVGRDVEHGLINAAETHAANLVLMGFSEEGAEGAAPESRRFDRLTHRISRGIDADLLVARFGPHDIGRVLVPITENSRGRLLSVVIRALNASGPPLTVRFLHVVTSPADRSTAEGLGRLLDRTTLAQFGTLDIVESDDRDAAVASRAENGDMMLLESSHRPSLIDDVLGSGAERIAERASCSSILIRERS